MRCVRVLTSAVLLATVAAPCAAGGAATQAASSSRPATTAATAPAPATRPGDKGAVMATVNGQPVYMQELTDSLVRSHGLPLAQQFIATEIVRQEAKRQGLAVNDAEVQAENDRMMIEIFGTHFDPQQRDGLLNQLLSQNHLSHEEWEMTVGRNALLRKLAESKVQITDDLLHDEFTEQYGRKIIVRHIEVGSIEAAQTILDKLNNRGDFVELAVKYSCNPSGKNGGLLPAFGAVAPGLPPALREAANALKQVGDLAGPIAVGNGFHIIKLQEIQEAKNVKFEDVQDKCRQDLQNRLCRAMGQQILGDLFRQASIEIVDPILHNVAGDKAAQ